MVDKNEFFREVTVRTCGSLDIDNALGWALDYTEQYTPLDILSRRKMINKVVHQVRKTICTDL